jgi:hypothetical protein
LFRARNQLLPDSTAAHFAQYHQSSISARRRVGEPPPSRFVTSGEQLEVI